MAGTIQSRLLAVGVLLLALASVSADQKGTVLWQIDLGVYSDSSPAIGAGCS